MMYLWISSPDSELFVPGALMSIPERQCLTYAQELVPHLRPGTVVSFTFEGLSNRSHEWRFKCT